MSLNVGYAMTVVSRFSFFYRICGLASVDVVCLYAVHYSPLMHSRLHCRHNLGSKIQGGPNNLVHFLYAL